MKTKKQPVINEELVLTKNQLIRALADYDNLRKRYEEEKSGWAKFASQSISAKLISVVDMFEDAQKHLADAGLAIAISELKKVLYEEGLVEVSSEAGTLIDERVHEVVDTIDGGEKGKIVETVVDGWRFKDGPVVRVAKVKVYKGE